ncbi:MAG: hypothetical protein GC129_01645 [Proteobacteria bacterium]|nr:hypothetical protein [Pseudomonadota bacterium]
MKFRHFTPILLAALACAAASGWAQSQAQYSSLGNNTLQRPTLTNTMNFDDCHNYSASISAKVCILIGKRNVADDVCKPNKFITCVMSHVGSYDYWEPSELIEVSCRKGYSLLLPGGIGSAPQDQACFGNSHGLGGKSSRWFFDARVWAINGKDGAAREQAAGSTLREQSVVCGANGPYGGINKLEGYGKKFDQFSRGGASGPGQSWEAYISDYDASWSSNGGGNSLPNLNEKCTGGADVSACWGPVQPLTGWVTHPIQPVAAALVGWRAHLKGLSKVSPAPGGWKMEMDYPYIMHTSPFGQGMGLQGGGGGRTQGSKCFQPGDPGPSWYTVGQKDLKPEQVPAFMQTLKAGNVTQAADLNPGVYIFTTWVHTACTLYAGFAGTNVQGAVNGCKDDQKM